MKIRYRCFIVAVAIMTITAFALSEEGYAAGGGKIFVIEVERSAGQAIAAWVENDKEGLDEALEKLTLNEAYLLAVGKSNREQSYLMSVPTSLGRNFNSVAAYLFLIRKEREGVNLWPVSLFEGERFEFEEKGATRQ